MAGPRSCELEAKMPEGSTSNRPAFTNPHSLLDDQILRIIQLNHGNLASGGEDVFGWMVAAISVGVP